MDCSLDESARAFREANNARLLSKIAELKAMADWANDCCFGGLRDRCLGVAQELVNYLEDDANA